MSYNQHDPPSSTRLDAVAFQRRVAHLAAARGIAKSRGATVKPADVHQRDDGSVSVTTSDGATTIVDAATVQAQMTPESLAGATRYIELRDAGRRSVRLARQLGRDSAAVPYSYRHEDGTLRTATRLVALPPRRASSTAQRRPRENRPAARRRTGASSRTASADPGESDPAGSSPPLRLRRANRYGLVSPNLLDILVWMEARS